MFSVFVLVAVSTGAKAADPQFCDAYATKAFSAAKAISEFNCGFQGPRWLLSATPTRPRPSARQKRLVSSIAASKDRVGCWTKTPIVSSV
jgi:hypothetical protein